LYNIHIIQVNLFLICGISNFILSSDILHQPINYYLHQISLYYIFEHQIDPLDTELVH